MSKACELSEEKVMFMAEGGNTHGTGFVSRLLIFMQRCQLLNHKRRQMNLFPLLFKLQLDTQVTAHDLHSESTCCITHIDEICFH